MKATQKKPKNAWKKGAVPNKSRKNSKTIPRKKPQPLELDLDEMEFYDDQTKRQSRCGQGSA